MDQMKKEARNAKSAMESVPAYVREERVCIEADALIRAIESVDFDTINQKLDDCKERACVRFPAQTKLMQRRRSSSGRKWKTSRRQPGICTDLEIKGCEAFVLRRFYNAVNHRVGVLGRDWNHNYEIYLETDKKEKTLLLEDGREERFLLTAAGEYASVYQGSGTLKQTDGGFEYITREQKIYLFDSQGYCICLETVPGSRVHLAYTNTENGRLLHRISKESAYCLSGPGRHVPGTQPDRGYRREYTLRLGGFFFGRCGLCNGSSQ